MKKWCLFLVVFLVSCTAPAILSGPSETEVSQRIAEIVKGSSCAVYRWQDRGRAPIGYMKGMALVYAKNVCALKRKNSAALQMAMPVGAREKDALKYYGIKNGTEAENLRSVFTLALGLGLRESSGKYCCGIDQSSKRYKEYLNGVPVKGESTNGVEAGTFQTSWNARGTNSEMPKLLPTYQISSSGCFLETFKEGVDPKYCSGGNALNFGDGPGLEYQKLSKSCPAFHAEYSIIGMRSLYNHWGPLISKAAEYRPECEAMLKAVEQVVEGAGCAP